MNDLVKQFLVSMAAFALVFSIYDHFKRPDTSETSPTVSQQVTEKSNEDSDDSDNSDESTSENKISATESTHEDTENHDDASDKPSRLEELRALDALQKQQHGLVSAYKNATLLALGLQVAGTPKMMLTEYFFENNKLPGSNTALGLEAPESFAYQALKSLHIEGEGVIVLTYNETTGVEDGTIRLRPDVSNMQAGIRWYCETSSYPDIAKVIPTCSYQP